MTAPKADEYSKTLISSALSRAAILAGAGLALPFATQADSIVYSGPQNITETSAAGTGDQSYTVSLADDDLSSFAFTASYASLNKQVYVTPVAATSFYVGDNSAPNSNPTALAAGTLINGDSTFTQGSGTIQENGLQAGGNWPADGTPAFLGVEFMDDNPTVGSSPDQTYCGWVELGASTSGDASFTINGWAYDSGGCSIDAGQTTPEPDSLALFALGAAGIIAFRARRRAIRS